MDIEILPVIHAAAAQVAVLEGKPELADKVEAGAGEGAEAADISCILGNFGFEEDNLETRSDHSRD